MNITRSSMAQVSFQGIGRSPLPSLLTCHPCTPSKLLPMSPVCTLLAPPPLTPPHHASRGGRGTPRPVPYFRKQGEVTHCEGGAGGVVFLKLGRSACLAK